VDPLIYQRRRQHFPNDLSNKKAAEGCGVVRAAVPVGNRANGGKTIDTRREQIDLLIAYAASGPVNAKNRGRIEAWQAIRLLWFGSFLPLSLPDVRWTALRRLARDGCFTP
jgi:hypothetical protein